MTVDERGLHLFFDAALDGAAWPGSLASHDAVVGETWCGPLGLLQRLETELGLVATQVTATERAAALASQLASNRGWWSRSLETDPLATAGRLLDDRDLLALWGWRGQRVGARLDGLWNATERALPGIPDRLLRVLAALPRRSIDLSSIELFDPIESMPPLWRALLDALAARGVSIAQRSLSLAAAHGDLGAARSRKFQPAGDGSLTLLRTHGALAAADEIAAALATCASLDGTVVIGGDTVLDGALVRHGLPRLGEPRGTTTSSALVRLVVETAFTPMDPDDLHALLCMDPGPVHGRLKRRLVRALGKFPARGSAEWTKARTESLANVDDEHRDGVAARFAALVDPVVARSEPLPFEALATRMRTLATWAHGRASSVPSLRATAVFAERVVALARATGETAFSRTTLRRLIDELEPPQCTGGIAEAGLAAVATPGAIVGPARTIVWWNFSRASAPAPSRLRLSATERAALAAAGVTPPDLGALMAAQARRWRRPLEQATDTLVLVCPYTNEVGDRNHPHPLWDELVANLDEGYDSHVLQRERLTLPAPARRAPASLRPLIKPVTDVRAPALELGETESPSSLETLLSCSLAWALQHKGKLWGGLGTAPGAPAPVHYGNIAHLVLEQVFGSAVASPEEAGARAEAIFDSSVGTLAEALHLPDFQTKRAELRRGVVLSAREVAQLVKKTGARIRGLEVPLNGLLGTTPVAGRTDLMLEDPDAIIDFKWGYSRYRKLLSSGTAFQLVAYAALAATNGSLPAIAYMTLQRQQLLAPAHSTLPDASGHRHTSEDMLAGALAQLDLRKSQVSRGELAAPSAIDDVEEGSLTNGVMSIEPKCTYCDLGAICGRRTRL